MKRSVILSLVFGLGLCNGAVANAANTATGTLSVVIQSPLAIVFTPAAPTISCSTAVGTVVTAISTTGGDGNAVTYTISGDTTDFALSGSNIVVASGGITSADCGKTEAITVGASQP